MSKLPRLYYYSPLLLLVFFARPSLDPLFDMFKIGGMGFGAVLNLFMLYALFAVLSHARFKVTRMMMTWIPLICVMAFSLLYTPYLTQGLRSLLVVITYMAAFIIPFHFIKSQQHFIECLKIIVYSSFIPLVAVLYEFAFPAGSTNINGFRLFSTFNHPNVFAFYLITVVSVCFFVIKSSMFDNEAKFRQQCWIVLLLSLICILGTKTRSAWAVCALLILLYGIFQEKRYLVYLFAAASVALMVPSIQDRVLDLFQGNDPDALLNDYEALNSYAWRKVIWAGALSKFWEQPILGFGYESFTYYSSAFFIIESDVGAGSHNTYIQVLFELGIIGFIAFLWLLVPILLRLWRLRKKARENIIIFALFVAYCLIHYSDNVFDYLVFNWYFWFFIGAYLALNSLQSIEEQQAENNGEIIEDQKTRMLKQPDTSSR